jgi:hypothetical protein
MLLTEPEGYVSVIASNFLHPLTKLLEGMDEFENKGPNEVQSSPLENGFSLGIIVLAILLTESAISRTQYRMGKTPPEKPLKFVRNIFPSDDFPERLEELFVLRDVIAHNHIWEAKVYWDKSGELRLVEAQLTSGYGDKKLERVIDNKTRTTRLLGLNLFPTRICRSDAIKVLQTAVDFLFAVEKLDPNYFSISNQWVKYKDSMITFTDLVSGLAI